MSHKLAEKSVRPAARAKKIPTATRVLDVSARLFNRHGIEGVSIQQIAAALPISLGNLTYHFNKKSDLLAAHVEHFDRQLNESMQALGDIRDPRLFTSVCVSVVRLIIRYRFLFGSANYITKNGLVPAARYDALIARTKRTFIEQFEHLAAEGVLKPFALNYNMALLVDALWHQWLGWVLDRQLNPPACEPDENELAADIGLRMLFVGHLHLDATFVAAVHGELMALRTAPPA